VIGSPDTVSEECIPTEHSQASTSVIVHVFTVACFAPGHNSMQCIWQFF
jgi:hypothetical protein